MAFSLPKNSRDLSLVICGEAGQGIATLERLLTRSAKLTGYHVFSTKEYMSRVRGGSNSSEIRISPERVHAFIERIDLLLPLSGPSAERLKNRISKDTLIIGEAINVSEELRSKCGAFIDIPFTKTAKDLGKAVYSNQVALGLIAKLFDLDISIIERELSVLFSGKGSEIPEVNIRAAKIGYAMGAKLIEDGQITPSIEKSQENPKELLISGTEAVGLGAIAGGCDFLAAYPMSPSTGVLTFLSKHAEKFGLIIEQCEDEIAGINMALGAWYAGSRALVSTSGGGFALMTEGVSLAAMLESPVVIHLAQRPGPATGLPTRTEQGDLELALYSGHGEFPRIILAPGSAREAFYLTQRAFNLAERYQVPVFILTDQYLLDSVVNTPPFELDGLKVEREIIETKREYKRYAATEPGLSPRGIPGFGKGFVHVDSDEHDEEGRITEDMNIRVQMVDKRLGKLKLIKRDILPPTLIGDKNAATVLLGWGSTLEVVTEALGKIKSSDILFIHNSQPYPIHPLTVKHIKKAKRLAVIEGNASGQFARLVRQETGREADCKILKYNGLQFSVEEIIERIGEFL
jgi:2-oxoglutarate ferredoxin oxidoreductase subunit alpha